MATFDDDDKKWLLDNFVTKSDASNLASKKDLNRLEKKIDTISNRLDTDHLGLRKRVDVIENKTGIQSPDL